MMDQEYDTLKDLDEFFVEAEDKINTLEQRIEGKKDRIEDLKDDLMEYANETDKLEEIDYEALDRLFQEKYVLLPKDEEESWVVVPRMFDFQVGWLERQTEAYNVFVVNKYINWINELPEEIKDRVPGLSSEFDGDVTVINGMIEFENPEEQDEGFDRYRDKVTRRKGDKKIHIRDGSEFDLIADLIDDGELPFKPKPVQDDDLRPDFGSIELRSYQERAWEKFKETGMIGVYWSPGAGKTYVSLYAGERIKGHKLVVIPSNTLKEQWNERIEEFCDDPSEWIVETYQYLTQRNNMEKLPNIKLTVFDECHRLPANTFSKLSTIDTDYRIGLSASPFREDGREDYIIALTGYPIGLKWRELIELGVVDEPEVKVYLYNTLNKKKKDLKELVDERTGKILIFCDSIDRGKELSEEMGVPFVHGETATGKRMDIARDNRVVIGSRVFDEGLSLDWDYVIEHDFHGSSRRQEAQRVGRGMHSESGDQEEPEHIVQMTQEEFNKFESRLYSLEEQGFQIRYENRVG